MIVNDMQIQIVLNTTKVGKLFLILAHIKADDVVKVKKCNHHISIPNISPGIIIRALAIQAHNSIIL
jgi:hypothetical protein